MLRWRPEGVILVNEVTLLPVFLRLAPARTVVARLPDAVDGVLAAHNVPPELVEGERAAMAGVRVAPTVNRSVVGMVNEFGYLASAMQSDEDLLSLAVHLADAVWPPVQAPHQPDRELAARAAEHLASLG